MKKTFVLAVSILLSFNFLMAQSNTRMLTLYKLPGVKRKKHS